MGYWNLATPAGIKQHFRISPGTKQVKQWDRNALGRYTYIYTNQGPFMHWLYQIGGAGSNLCSWEQGVIQNIGHIRKYKQIGDGKAGRWSKSRMIRSFARRFLSSYISR